MGSYTLSRGEPRTLERRLHGKSCALSHSLQVSPQHVVIVLRYGLSWQDMLDTLHGGLLTKQQWVRCVEIYRSYLLLPAPTRSYPLIPAHTPLSNARFSSSNSPLISRSLPAQLMRHSLKTSCHYLLRRAIEKFHLSDVWFRLL